ncbi:HTH domain-containing protein [Bacillus pseudomycoides]|uniref:HTH domain-containing protein n=1 Tax=Bacillus bingmayongensis TaxID=1150157 RepID=A0ABU5JSG5_9BACI|nr:HTH domain-containing protein [Bacillus pseudomycoides]
MDVLLNKSDKNKLKIFQFLLNNHDYILANELTKTFSFSKSSVSRYLAELKLDISENHELK